MSVLNFQDSTSLRGEVMIFSTSSETGKTELLLEDKNLIVLNGRQYLAKGLVNTATAYITDVAFGSGGTLPSSPSTALPVNATDTTVNIPITGLIKNTDYFFNVIDQSMTAVTPRIVFNIVIPTTSALNSQTINESALMLNTNPETAFAIKRFANISKSSAISISINWTIYF